LRYKCGFLFSTATIQRASGTGTAQVHINDTIVAKWVADLPTKAVAVPPGEQLISVRVNRQGNDYIATVSNHGGAPMTGYAIALLMYGSGKGTRHFYDVRMLGRPPINPGGSVPERIAGILVDAKPLAAVFADGTTFGDSKDVADLMARRTAKITALAETVSVLCTAQQKGSHKQGAIASLEATTSKVSEATVMLNSIETAVYTEALDKLKRAAPSKEISIPEILSGLENTGKPLFADPVKDASGALYIKSTPTVLSCGAAR
jgi:hypothetical protein